MSHRRPDSRKVALKPMKAATGHDAFTQLAAWMASWSMLILTALYGLRNTAPWSAWTLMISLTACAFLCAMTYAWLARQNHPIRGVFSQAAWLTLGLAYIATMLLAERIAPAFFAAFASLAIWCVTLQRGASESQHSEPRNNEPQQSPENETSPAKAVSVSDDSSPHKPAAAVSAPEKGGALDFSDMTPLISHWIERLREVSARLDLLTESRRRGRREPLDRPGSVDTDTEVQAQADRLRVVLGRLQQLIEAACNPVGEVRLSLVFESLAEVLDARARRAGVELIRPTASRVSPIRESFAHVQAAFYHVLDAAIGCAKGTVSRTVSLDLTERGQTVRATIDAPSDPTTHAGYRQGLRLLDAAGAHVSTHKGAAGVRIVISFPSAGPRSRKDLRPVVPARAAPAQKLNVNGNRNVKTAGANGRRAPLRILHVDDDREMRELVADMLGMRDAIVDATDSLETVERLVALHRYDAAILDIHLPGTSGVEIFERMTELAPEMARRTIFCTGAVLGSHVQRFIREHECPVVTKPFDSSALARAIRTVLAREEPEPARPG